MSNFYFTDELIGKGIPVLLKNGAIAKQRLIDYINELLLNRNYIPIASPHVANLALFEKSGHYPYYKESMFPVIESKDEKFTLKPMNCPFHIMSYDRLGIVSYKDLPIKFYEFGQVYRYEDSGALNGLFRVRSFTQDDGHIFCSMNQIRDIINECIELVKFICQKFQLELSVKFSRRDLNNKEKYVGPVDNWGASEDILKSICFENFQDKYVEDSAGAAFYGPKIDFIAKDKLNREWQLGTIQLDFNLPELFDINYINSENEKEKPVLIHRALLGSIERFLGILLENDLLPLYLQPFNMGVIWIGNNEQFLNDCVIKLKSLGIYPTVVKSPKNLSEAMSQLFSKDISNITIVGKKEEQNDLLNFNKETMSSVAYYDKVSKMYNL